MSVLCKHFGECGGCKYQDISYKEQLRQKEERVKELASLSGIDTQLKPINSYDNWFYRGKMEFSFSQGQCGLYGSKEKRKVVDIQECLIFSPDTGKILKAVKDFVRSKSYSSYDRFSHQGFLRNLIIRKARFTKQIMVGIVTTTRGEFDRQGFVDALRGLSLESQIKSIYWIGNDSLSDAVIFEKKELIFGSAFIMEELGSLKLNIGIDSFFQNNSLGIGDLYARIKKYAGLEGSERILDLFCGVGSIGLFLADSAKFVWGVEVQKEIVEVAWQNAKNNNINNISFFFSDVRRFLNSQGAFYKDIDILIMNPPRSGLSKKIIRAVLRLSPKTIFYSSCNPSSFFTDLKGLTTNYKVDFIESFDFFPHTPHLECLGVLRKNN
ncbi:MAG: 23S rRNA (uracil(1939)-C(5))-methyltransferase RlmD [Candidatus Omnitrophota bacterium]|nr:MAG: 23S rRNA (uracil(1939)-C(5))-methyltransferase RlmD [Candidatus Omnitrophota bacterium]